MADAHDSSARCSVDGCDRKRKAKGYCLKHYKQVRRTGKVRISATRCAHCDAEFVPAVSTAIYCSKRCKALSWRKANPERAAELQERHGASRVSKVKSGCCIECGKPYCRRTLSSYCSEACRSVAEARRSRLRAREAYAQKHGTRRPCKQCGAVFEPAYTGGRRQTCCSPTCKAARNEAIEKSNRKIAKAKRRAVERGAAAESIDPIRVFERDKWRCHICGKATLRAKRGTTDARAPELDHIVSLAQGGAHTWGNVACACRQCNGKKGAMSAGQIGLPFAA